MTSKNKPKCGPKPNHLKIDMENWEEAIGKALRTEKPKDGWPDKSKKKKS
jgi:hypothetical protein